MNDDVKTVFKCSFDLGAFEKCTQLEMDIMKTELAHHVFILFSGVPEKNVNFVNFREKCVAK